MIKNNNKVKCKDIIINCNIEKKIFNKINTIQFIFIECCNFSCYSYNKKNDYYNIYKDNILFCNIKINNNNNKSIFIVYNIINSSIIEFNEVKKNLKEGIEIIEESYI